MDYLFLYYTIFHCYVKIVTLAYVHDVTGETPHIDCVPRVLEYIDVFPIKLPCLPSAEILILPRLN